MTNNPLEPACPTCGVPWLEHNDADSLRHNLQAVTEQRDKLLEAAKAVCDFVLDNDLNNKHICEHCGVECNHATDCPLMILVVRIEAAIAACEGDNT